MKLIKELNKWLEEMEYVIVNIKFEKDEIAVKYYDEYGNQKMQFFSK